MFKKKDADSDQTKATPVKDETAYEDAWYRSLKALAEATNQEDDEETAEPTES